MEQITHAGPGRPPGVRAADTRGRIVRAALEVFAEVGYDAATLQVIAARARLSRPAVSHHFPDKKTLYLEALAAAQQLYIVPASAGTQQETGLLGRLSALIGAGVQANEEHTSLLAFLVSAVVDARRHPELPAFDISDLRHFLTWAIGRAVEDGELAIACDVSSLVEMIVAMMWGVGLYGGFFGGSRQVRAVADTMELLLASELWQLGEEPGSAQVGDLTG